MVVCPVESRFVRCGRRVALVGLIVLAMLAVAFALSGCSGCVDKHGEPPSQKEVLAYVRQECPTEGFELMGVEQTGEEPDEYTYTFRSTERDLQFTATSYLKQMYFDASPLGWYEPSVRCDYVYQVHCLYDSEMRAALVKSGLYATYAESGADDIMMGTIFVRGEEDFDAAARCLARMSAIYSAESAYNSEAWLLENYYDRIYVNYLSTFETGIPYSYTAGDVMVATFDIDGTLQEDDIRSTIRDQYAQLVVDRKIDGALPSGLDGVPHKSFLTTYVDGNELSYTYDDAPNEEAARGCGLFMGEEDAYWSDALGTYAMRVDIGYVAYDSGGTSSLRSCVFPWFSEEGTWQAESRTSFLGGSTYSIEYVSLAGIGHSVTVDRNSDDVPTRVTHQSGSSRAADLVFDTLRTTDAINDYHVVGISVEDFAALFDFEYQIDEEQGTVSFF